MGYLMSFLILFLVLPVDVQAQLSDVQNFIQPHLDILGKNLSQKTDYASSKSFTRLVNSVPNLCEEDLAEKQKCEDFAHSRLPNLYKKQGWSTLFEIKYQALEDAEIQKDERNDYAPLDFTEYEATSLQASREPQTAEEFELKAQAIKTWSEREIYIPMLLLGTSLRGKIKLKPLDLFEIKTQLIINQILNEDNYAHLPTMDAKNTHLYQKLGEYTKTMDDKEFSKFVSTISGAVGYNQKRSKLAQSEDGAFGIATAYQQITGTKIGICGDVHTMAAKMAEQRGWEAFTVGYALKDTQHVVTAMVNPKDPHNLMIVNYMMLENQDLNSGNWINPTPKNAMTDIGIQLRIFKNEKPGSASGKMQQIATIPTALGGFMSDLFKRNNEVSRAMPHNENFQITKMGIERNVQKISANDDFSKFKDKHHDQQLLIYEGQADGAQIYGVAVNDIRYKEIYKWDPQKRECVLTSEKNSSIGVATSVVNNPLLSDQKAFYIYLNMKGGKIYHVYQSKHFQFKGLLGYELDGFLARDKKGEAGMDINVRTMVGVAVDYAGENTSIQTKLTVETNPAIVNQPSMYDFTQKWNKIINPIGFNAASLDVNASQKLSPQTQLVSNNNISFTKVGNRVLFSTGIIHKNTSIMASYQGGFKSFDIGNTLRSVNLTKNFNGLDGFRLSATQQIANRSRSLSGSVSGYVGLGTGAEKVKPVAGATLKMNLNLPKKKGAGR